MIIVSSKQLHLTKLYCEVSNAQYANQDKDSNYGLLGIFLHFLSATPLHSIFAMTS